MPFGKKKDKKESEKSGYPTQGLAYPSQGSAYPSQPPAAPPHQQMYGAPQGAPPAYSQGPPPPYTPQGAAGGYQAPPPQGYYPAPQGYAPPPQQQRAPPIQRQGTNTTVVVQGGFDAGARFDGVAQPNIPPPPPGCMPNAAQAAMAHGHNVAVTQQKGNFWDGGSDGGYVLF